MGLFGSGPFPHTKSVSTPLVIGEEYLPFFGYDNAQQLIFQTFHCQCEIYNGNFVKYFR